MVCAVRARPFHYMDDLKECFLGTVSTREDPSTIIAEAIQDEAGTRNLWMSTQDDYVRCTTGWILTSKPSVTMLIGWFIAGLRKEYRGILAVGAQELDNLDEAVEIASRVERNTRKQKKTTKKHKEVRSSSSSDSSSEEDSSSEDSSSDSEKKTKSKSKKKLKKVEAMMTKLKTGGSTSTFRPGVYCPRCSNEGHTKEECKMNTKYCAICVTTNNHTMEDCRFNGARRAVRAEVPAMQVQAQPQANMTVC